MKYGMPYKGSKNKLTEQIFELFPRKKNFYDLFCGGCSMIHYGLLHGSFENYFMNDINPVCTELFMDAVHGKFKDEKRWISREDFFRLKDSEPYVAFCWSFGNGLTNYLYAKEIEPFRKAQHYAIYFDDYSLFKNMGINISTLDGKSKSEKYHDLKKKIKADEEILTIYKKWYLKEILKLNENQIENAICTKTTDLDAESEKLRNYLKNALTKSGLTASEIDRRCGTNGMAGHWFGKSQWEFPTSEMYQLLQQWLDLPLAYYEATKYYASLGVCLQSLQSLQSLERLQSLESFNKSYDEIEIKENSVIYCDIPYEGTSGYLTEFDFEKFYSWCEKQTEPLFISSYKMPAERFVCVAMFKHRCTLSATKNIEVTEKVFIPKHQEKEYHLPGSLFNFDELM